MAALWQARSVSNFPFKCLNKLMLSSKTSCPSSHIISPALGCASGWYCGTLRLKNSPMIPLSLIRKAIVPTWAGTELTKANDFNGSTAKRELWFTKPGGRGGPYTSTYVLRTTPANIIPRKESTVCTVCLLPVGSAEPGQLWMAQNGTSASVRNSLSLCVWVCHAPLSLPLLLSHSPPLSFYSAVNAVGMGGICQFLCFCVCMRNTSCLWMSLRLNSVPGDWFCTIVLTCSREHAYGRASKQQWFLLAYMYNMLNIVTFDLAPVNIIDLQLDTY